MAHENIFDELEIFDGKFNEFYQHRKKVSALKNFSEAEHFSHKPYLLLIRKCMDAGFLDREESDFLEHMLQKYEMNYLDWSHKTKWVKNMILEGVAKREKAENQLFFDMEKLKSSVQLPFTPTAQQPNSKRIAV